MIKSLAPLAKKMKMHKISIFVQYFYLIMCQISILKLGKLYIYFMKLAGGRNLC